MLPQQKRFGNNRGIWIRVAICLITSLTLMVGNMVKAETVTGISQDATIKVQPVLMLKPTANLISGKVTLGDIFDGLSDPRLAGQVIGDSPLPGQKAILDTATLSHLVRQYQLNWRPSGVDAQIVLQRVGQNLPVQQIETALLREMSGPAYAGQNLPTDIGVDMTVTPAKMMVSDLQATTIQVAALDIDPNNRRFTAQLRITAPDMPDIDARATGSVWAMLDIPVFNRRISPGETIAAGDVITIRLKEKQVSANIISNPNELIGYTVRRAVNSQIPITRADIIAPTIVLKGKMVTVNYQTANMALSLQGKALDNGSTGQEVRVLNITSNKIVTGIVQPDGTINVIAPAVPSQITGGKNGN